MELCQGGIHFAVNELDMFGAIGGVIGHDHDEVEAETDGCVELVNATHHEAAIACKHNNRFLGCCHACSDGFLKADADGSEVCCCDEALGALDREADPDLCHEAASVCDEEAVFGKHFFEAFKRVDIVDAALGCLVRADRVLCEFCDIKVAGETARGYFGFVQPVENCFCGEASVGHEGGVWVKAAAYGCGRDVNLNDAFVFHELALICREVMQGRAEANDAIGLGNQLVGGRC